MDSPLATTWWTPWGRLAAFALAATSIACLLAEFYGIGSMRVWVCVLLAPACLALAVAAWVDWRCNDGRFARMIAIGTIAGLAAAVAYDVFRLPFVWASEWHLEGILPPLNLFKVFPRFGAMILGQPLEQPAYSLPAHLIGWSYHFSNGATFGVMYLAMIGNPARRHWVWAVVMALGLEVAMLFTPYPAFFGIRISPAFIAATVSAHMIFGVALGLFCRRWVERLDHRRTA